MSRRLDERLVKALEAPEKGNAITYDSEVKGFGCRVTAAGAKAFVLNYRVGGRERRITVGSWPDWSVVAARKKAGELKRETDNGLDPMAERHAEREAPTMEDLARDYEERHAPRKRTGAADVAVLKRFILPRLGRIKVKDITHRQVEDFHRERSKTSPTQANREVALLSKMFALAIKWGYREDNPAKGIERNPEERRARYLMGEELAALSAAMRDHRDQRSANVVRLLLLTGCRRGEALTATWDQLDLAAGVWVKPSAHTKTKKEHRVPLSPPAVKLLADIRAAQEAKAAEAKQQAPAYVFPGDQGVPHITDIKKSWHSLTRKASVRLWASRPDSSEGAIVARLAAELKDGAMPIFAAVEAAAKVDGTTLPLGLTDVRLHDLRHSYASMLVSAGLSLPVIGALLGHTQTQTTARYAHLFDDPLRAATAQVGAMIEAADGRGN